MVEEGLGLGLGGCATEPDCCGDDENWVYDTAYTHRNVTPLVEIYSVSIHCEKNVKRGEKCEIYGCIRVIDDKSGEDFDLFVRGKDDPECVDNDGTLLLSPPLLASDGVFNVVIPSEYVSLDVCLFDKARNDMVIAKGDFELNRRIIDCKGEQTCEVVAGDGGFASVHYAIFPFAVVANVDILFFGKDDDFDVLDEHVKEPDIVPCPKHGYRRERYDEVDKIDYDNREYGIGVADVFGTISAHNGIFRSEGNDCHNESVLFRKKSEQSVQVKSGEFIKLSRSVVAVPANSTLKIEVDLFDRGSQLPIGKQIVEFKPEDEGTYKKDIVGDYGRIRVRVQWNDAYQQLYRPNQPNRPRKLKWSGEDANTPEIQNGDGEKRPKIILQACSQSLASVFSNGSIPSAVTSKFFGRTNRVEVFSVVICGKEFEPFNFYGYITVNGGDFSIFSKDENCPQHCPALGTQLMIGCHDSCDLYGDFCIWIKLKDLKDRSIISRGYMIWIEFWTKATKWTDRRLCSIIRGERGFAAVHYAIFFDSLAVKVDVKLYGRSSLSTVSGKIVARYEGHDYSSSYDKEYYQSVLFHKDAKEELPLQVCGGSSIPLLKSVVAMAIKSTLVLEVDLSLTPVHVEGSKLPLEAESVQGCAKFKFSADGECLVVSIGQDSYVELSAKCEQI